MTLGLNPSISAAVNGLSFASKLAPA